MFHWLLLIKHPKSTVWIPMLKSHRHRKSHKKSSHNTGAWKTRVLCKWAEGSTHMPGGSDGHKSVRRWRRGRNRKRRRRLPHCAIGRRAAWTSVVLPLYGGRGEIHALSLRGAFVMPPSWWGYARLLFMLPDGLEMSIGNGDGNFYVKGLLMASSDD